MTRKTRYTLIAALAVATCLSNPLAGQECAPSESGCLVDVGYAGATIQFSPLEEFRTLTLTLSGPGGDLVRTFTPGDRVELDVREVGAGEDGRYAWTLRREAPVSDELRATLVAARLADPGTAGATAFERKHELPAGPFTASGFFEVRDGTLVDPREVEESAPTRAGNEIARKVVLSNSDGVIRNSLCVGFDCPNSPSFSDTTILLMENNARIKFDDTSNTASFPNNDWEIQANSNLNGGPNHLAFNDCGQSTQGGCAEDPVFGVEAGVRSRALWVDSGGDVGVGTGTPIGDVHIVTGNTPFLRLEQDNSSGFAPQTWDVAGNETNFFIRDATNASTLPLRIQPGASSNALFIASSGNVGLGTSSPSKALTIRRTTGKPQLFLQNAAAGGETWQLGHRDTNESFAITRIGSGATELELSTTGNLTISGSLTVGPGGCTGCDLVFSPEYELESIEDHAAYMWANRHLPGVGPTPEDAPMNLSQKTGGILNELEKAHIYIEELHTSLKEGKAELADLRSRNQELLERLERVESIVLLQRRLE